MIQNAIPEFMVIDDDPTNNLICLRVIQLTIPGAVVHTFTNPEKVLEYIESAYTVNHVKTAVLLLDINMPLLTGWEVLAKIREFQGMVKERLQIFMLSSSVDLHDKEKARNEDIVSGYIIKPMSRDNCKAFLPRFQQDKYS